MATNDTLMTLRGWEETLGDLQSKIQATLQGSENEFLEAGSRLQGFLSRSREVSTLCTAAVELTGEDMMGHIAAELQLELEQMGKHLTSSSGSTARSISNMAEMFVAITELNETRRGFKKIIRTLRVLAISTRIESARLGSNEFGFNTLADDVEKLARQIEAKYGSIVERAQNLLGLVEDVLNKTQSLSLLQRKTANDVLLDTRSSIDEIIRINAKSSEVSGNVSTRLNHIMSRIHEVVTTLQFHDITRQQLEHVSEAFDDARSRVSRALGNGDGAGPAVREAAGWVGDVCELESSQLENSKDELFDAVSQMVDNLRGISEGVQEALRSIRSIMKITSGAGGSLLEGVEGHVEKVIRLLSESHARTQEMGASMASVSVTVGDMERFVSDIEEIGAEIELIALNARIKAAHTGTHGEALGVLAEAIQKLSADARGETETVSNALVAITTGARILREANSGEAEGQGQLVDAMAEALHALILRLRGLDGEFMDSVERMGEMASQLADEIREVADGMKHHFVVAETVDSVRGGLAVVVQESREIVPLHEIEDREQRLAELMSRYTMQSERKVHQSALGEEANSDDGSGKGQDGLGSNVELF